MSESGAPFRTSLLFFVNVLLLNSLLPVLPLLLFTYYFPRDPFSAPVVALYSNNYLSAVAKSSKFSFKNQPTPPLAFFIIILVTSTILLLFLFQIAIALFNRSWYLLFVAIDILLNRTVKHLFNLYKQQIFWWLLHDDYLPISGQNCLDLNPSYVLLNHL